MKLKDIKASGLIPAIPAGMRALEIIGFNIESCVIAQAAGAHRIELCDNASEGGTTASHGFIKSAREVLNVDLYPIIRPRGGDFLYSDEEFTIMKTDVQLCKQLGCDGVVIGMLNADGNIDKRRCSKLVSLAYPLGVTFHRAFDRCIDPLKAMEDIIDIGCERILTSGQQPTALEGAALIKELIEKAYERIIIMPGSGVKSNNIKIIAEQTGATEFHSSASVLINSVMQHNNPSMQENLQSVTADANEIKEMITQLKQHFKNQQQI